MSNINFKKPEGLPEGSFFSDNVQHDFTKSLYVKDEKLYQLLGIVLEIVSYILFILMFISEISTNIWYAAVPFILRCIFSVNFVSQREEVHDGSAKQNQNSPMQQFIYVVRCTIQVYFLLKYAASLQSICHLDGSSFCLQQLFRNDPFGFEFVTEHVILDVSLAIVLFFCSSYLYFPKFKDIREYYRSSATRDNESLGLSLASLIYFLYCRLSTSDDVLFFKFFFQSYGLYYFTGTCWNMISFIISEFAIAFMDKKTMDSDSKESDKFRVQYGVLCFSLLVGSCSLVFGVSIENIHGVYLLFAMMIAHSLFWGLISQSLPTSSRSPSLASSTTLAKPRSSFKVGKRRLKIFSIVDGALYGLAFSIIIGAIFVSLRSLFWIPFALMAIRECVSIAIHPILVKSTSSYSFFIVECDSILATAVVKLCYSISMIGVFVGSLKQLSCQVTDNSCFSSLYFNRGLASSTTGLHYSMSMSILFVLSLLLEVKSPMSIGDLFPRNGSKSKLKTKRSISRPLVLIYFLVCRMFYLDDESRFWHSIVFYFPFLQMGFLAYQIIRLLPTKYCLKDWISWANEFLAIMLLYVILFSVSVNVVIKRHITGDSVFFMLLSASIEVILAILSVCCTLVLDRTEGKQPQKQNV